MAEFNSRDAILQYIDEFKVERGEAVDRQTIVNWCYTQFASTGLQRTTFQARIGIMTIGTQSWSDQSHMDGHDDVFIVENGNLVRFDPMKHSIPE